MKNLFVFIVFLLFTGISHGQTPEVSNVPYIEVTGTAEKEVIPDEIFIGITMRERYEGKEKITVEAQEEKLKEALKAIGINLANFTLSDANADYIRVKWRSKDVITQKNYVLKVADANTVAKVFEQLDKLNIKEADIDKVSHSKIEELKKETRILAIKAAKEKADYLLNAIGEQTGKPLMVTENRNYLVSPSHLAGAESNIRLYKSPAIKTYSDEKELEVDDSIQFQKIKIQSSVYVKFAIK